MSGLEPVRLKDGGFPDLTGDGKVTRADILKGRGVEGFAEGGDADKSFYNPQKTAPGTGANIRDFTDLLFDPTDPVDYLVLGMMAFPPAGIAAKLIQAGVKGNKLRSTLKKVEAAKGLTLGPTREGVKGKAGQLLLRQEMADLIPHNRPGAVFSYSDEMKEYIRENPDETYEGGLPALIESMRELGDVGKEVYEIAQTEDGRQAIAEEIKGIPSALASSVSEADYSRYNPLELLPDSFTKRPSEINKKADGGIMMLSKGGDVASGALNLSRVFLNKVKKNPKLQNKDGSPKKSTKEYKDEVKKQQEAKKAETAKKRAETRRAKQEAQAREEAERQARLSRAEAARARTGETPQQRLNSQSAQADVGPARPIAGADGPIPSQGPAIASKVDESFDASKKTDMEGSVAPPLRRPFYKKKRYMIPAGAAVAASLLPLLSKDEKPEPNLRNINPEILPDNVDLKDRKDTLTIQGSSNMVGRTGNKIDENPETNQSLMYYMKQNLNEKGFDLDADTQTFTGDKKPTFFDYVKSLPSGYVDKVADDENYAKKMMAGFLNMMKPVEGYVPINPLVAFGEGYLGEETRQADMLPADAKLLEYLKRNKGALAKLQSLEATRAGTTIGEGAGSDDVLAGYVLLKEGLREEYGIGEDEIANYDIYYIDPKTKQETFVSSRMFGSLFDNPIKEIANPNFILKLRGT